MWRTCLACVPSASLKVFEHGSCMIRKVCESLSSFLSSARHSKQVCLRNSDASYHITAAKRALMMSQTGYVVVAELALRPAQFDTSLNIPKSVSKPLTLCFWTQASGMRAKT